MDPILEIRGVSKFYPPNLWAVKNVSLAFDRGLIHAIIGENGAGKSTLMKICYGLVPFEKGEIYLKGQHFIPKNPQHTMSNGIGMVHQEFMLFDELSVYENILLGYEPTKMGVLDRAKMQAVISQKNKQYGFNLDIHAPVGSLSIAAKQKVELLKLLFLESEILIFDEPTAVLTPQESREFFEHLQVLKKSGKTIFYIGHKLEDILQISDTISILQKGILKAHYPEAQKADLSKKQLISHMIGSDTVELIQRNQIDNPKPILEVRSLSLLPNSNYQKGLKNIDLTIKQGQIVGVAAVEGNGQSELVQAIVGALKPSSGSIFLNSKDISSTLLEERRKDMAFVSPNRALFSSCQTASILHNIIMGHHVLSPFNTRFGFLRHQKLEKFATSLVDTYHVSITNLASPISSLSGGNQQKLILARESEKNSSLLVLEQPSRGLDVNSVQYIHNLVLQKRSEGCGVFLVSSDLDELLALSDTILVMFEGEIVAQYPRESFNLEEIGHKMLVGAL
ncbi:MAG: ABC transporter ATP-binding protein [Brevinema sp.]